ncbi:hypothetical protein LINPERHAP1_LOCUS26373 [Linum perenne]
MGSRLMVFRFAHEVDPRRAVDEGPWIFDQSLLLLKELKQGDHPALVELCYADYWVQVYDMPGAFYTEAIGKGLGNYIGKFVEYDERNEYVDEESYMILRVTLDVCQPLKGEKKVKRHIDRYCEVLYRVASDKVVRLWDERLKAPPRAQRAKPGDRYLNRREGRGGGRMEEEGNGSRQWGGGDGESGEGEVDGGSTGTVGGGVRAERGIGDAMEGEKQGVSSGVRST